MNLPLLFKLKNSDKIFYFCLRWTAFWLFAVSLHVLFIHSENVLKHYTSLGYSLAYFMIVIASTVFIFETYKKIFLIDYYLTQFFWIGVSFVVFLLINPVVNYYIPLKPELKEYLLEIKFYYPFFYFGSTCVKVVDIAFQQTLIFIFIQRVKTLSGDPKKSMILFGFCFFILHLPLFYFFKWAAFAFLFPSILAGFIFSYLNLYYKKSGILFCFIVHETFYIILGVSFRLYY